MGEEAFLRPALGRTCVTSIGSYTVTRLAPRATGLPGQRLTRWTPKILSEKKSNLSERKSWSQKLCSAERILGRERRDFATAVARVEAEAHFYAFCSLACFMGISDMEEAGKMRWRLANYSEGVDAPQCSEACASNRGMGRSFG